MTKQEAISYLVAMKGENKFVNPYREEALSMAIAALQDQEERQWIPVTERLPDKPMRCLVYTKRGEYGGYEITYYNQGFYTQYAEVTHWMQLPELPQPPKEEDSK